MMTPWKTGLLIGALAAALFGCGGEVPGGEVPETGQTASALMTVNVPVTIDDLGVFIGDNACDNPATISASCDVALTAQDLHQCVEADPTALCGNGTTTVADKGQALGCFLDGSGRSVRVCCFVRVGGYVFLSCQDLPDLPPIIKA